MKTALRIVGSLIGLLLLAGLVLYFMGRSLPEKHTSRVTAVLPAARPLVWAIIGCSLRLDALTIGNQRWH